MSNAKVTISIRFAEMLFLAALQIRDKDPAQSGVNRHVNSESSRVQCACRLPSSRKNVAHKIFDWAVLRRFYLGGNWFLCARSVLEGAICSTFERFMRFCFQ